MSPSRPSSSRSLLESDLGFTPDGIFFSANANRLTFFELFESFKRASAEADIVLVYYAGHGMESLDGKENLLLPVEVDVAGAVRSEAVLRATGINLMALTADLADATPGANPGSGDTTTLRALRGGSWDFGIENMLRSSFRFPQTRERTKRELWFPGNRDRAVISVLPDSGKRRWALVSGL